MTAKEALIIQKLDELRRASEREGQRHSLWANGRGYTDERTAYTEAKNTTDSLYKELVGLLVTE